MLTNRYGITGTDGHLFDLVAQTWSDVAPPPPNQMTSIQGRTFSPPFYSSPKQRLWTGSELLELISLREPRFFRAATEAVPTTPPRIPWRSLPPLPTSLASPQWADSAVVGYTTAAGRPVVVHYLPT